MGKLGRAIGLAAAAIFVFEAWVWDGVVRFGRRVVDLIPWRSLKDALARLVARLPAPVVLAIFIIPVIVILPFKLAALYLIAHGRFVLGAATFIAAKFAGVGVTAFLFDICRDKLLTMGWLRWLHDHVMSWLAWAHRVVAPYKAQLRALMAEARAAMRRRLGLALSNPAPPAARADAPPGKPPSA